jgi:quercetin dioxygenase-like cupin family protein
MYTLNQVLRVPRIKYRAFLTEVIMPYASGETPQVGDYVHNKFEQPGTVIVVANVSGGEHVSVRWDDGGPDIPLTPAVEFTLISSATKYATLTVKEQTATRVNPSEETIKIGPVEVRFLLTSNDSNGSVSVFEVLVQAGQKLVAPAHKNDAYEEVLYGIEGVLTWTVDGTPVNVGPGQALCIPRGAVHRFDNSGSVDAKQLCVITPAIMGPSYFREAAEVIGAATGRPPDRAKMSDVFRRHGMTVASPPAK